VNLSNPITVYRRLNAKREENLTKYTGPMYAHITKAENNRKRKDEKGGDNKKKQES